MVSGFRHVESTAVVLEILGDHSCSDTTSHAGRPESSTSLLEEPQIAQILFNAM
jgi:hypothetical protein